MSGTLLHGGKVVEVTTCDVLHVDTGLLPPVPTTRSDYVPFVLEEERMPAAVVVGAQWGDEGKGKIVDHMTEKSDMVVRFQGGNNAGHTLVVGGRKQVLHLIPSGILQPHAQCVVGPGVVIDPWVLVKELRAIREEGFLNSAERLLLCERASMILPYHRSLDHLREAAAGKNKIGTTGRGIGPAYEDAVGRRAIRLGLLKDPVQLRAQLEKIMREKNALIEHYGGTAVSVDEMVASCMEIAPEIIPHLGDSCGVVAQALADGQNILFEGAQGTLLDVLHGTYPFVTSSHTVAGTACTAMGIGPAQIQRVVAVTKAYTTRVGMGPFPTELEDAMGERIRELGGEFGATTGRPRRCGWLDLVALKHAVQINGATDVVLTKVDVLSGLDELQLCVGYRLESGEEVEHLPWNMDLATVEPIYESISGWSEDITGARSLHELPETVHAYVKRVEDWIGVPIKSVSVGPDREQTIPR